MRTERSSDLLERDQSRESFNVRIGHTAHSASSLLGKYSEARGGGRSERLKHREVKKKKKRRKEKEKSSQDPI